MQDVARSHLSSESPSPQTTHRACAASEFHLTELPYSTHWSAVGRGGLKAQDGWQRCRLPSDRFTISVQRFMYTSRLPHTVKKSPNFRVRPLSRLVCASVRQSRSNQVFCRKKGGADAGTGSGTGIVFSNAQAMEHRPRPLAEPQQARGRRRAQRVSRARAGGRPRVVAGRVGSCFGLGSGSGLGVGAVAGGSPGNDTERNGTEETTYQGGDLYSEYSPMTLIGFRALYQAFNKALG